MSDAFSSSRIGLCWHGSALCVSVVNTTTQVNGKVTVHCPKKHLN